MGHREQTKHKLKDTTKENTMGPAANIVLLAKKKKRTKHKLKKEKTF